MNPFEGYRISSPYGERWGVKHRGVDLVKTHRALISSFTAGRVIFSGQTQVGTGLGNYGIAVVVQDDSPQAALHLYAHLDSIAVIVGEVIRIGTVVGRQGNTGDVRPMPTPDNPSAGSHLHYEVRLKSVPSFGFDSETDPATYLLWYLNWKEEEQMLEELKNQIVQLVIANKQLQQRLKEVEHRQSMSIPGWAKEAVLAAVNATGKDGQPLINTPDGGSYDFYRILTVLHRKGLF